MSQTRTTPPRTAQPNRPAQPDDAAGAHGVLATTARLVALLARGCTLLLAVAGIPWALNTYAPMNFPTLAGVVDGAGRAIGHPAAAVGDLGQLLQQPITDGLVLQLLAVAAWLIWAALALSVLTETVALAAGIQAPRLPGLGGLQAVAAWLLTGTLAGLIATTAAVGDPSAATAADAVPLSAALSSSTQTPTTQTPTTQTSTNPTSTTSLGDDHEQLAYVVQDGDWLGGIAQRFLGDFDAYPRLQQANQDLIPRTAGPRGPDHIEPGWRITLPADAHDRGPMDHAAGRTSAAEASTPKNESQRGVPTTTPEPTGAPAPTSAASTPTPAAGVAPTSRPTTTSSPAPSTTHAPSRADATPTASTAAPTASPTASPTTVEAAASPSEGVDVEGGWITWPMAVALTALAGLVWLTRRRLHRYTDPFTHETRPDQPDDLGPDVDLDLDSDLAPAPEDEQSDDAELYRTGRHVLRDDDQDLNEDQDLRPLPAVLNRVRALVRAHGDEIAAMTPATRPAAPSTSDVAPRPVRVVAEVLPPVGPSGVDLAGLPPIPGQGLGLTGPGAADAARALLVATVTSGSPHDPDAAGVVVTTFDTLNDLLGGPDTLEAAAIPRLHVTANLDEALSVLDDVVLTRRRVLDEHDATDPRVLREEQPWSQPMPPTLLIAHAPPAQAGPLKARLSTTLHLGEPVQVSGVLLGDWPRGHTLDVDQTGSLTGTPDDAARVAVLARDPAVDLLRLVVEAHTGHQPEPLATVADLVPVEQQRLTEPALPEPALPEREPLEPAGAPVEPRQETPRAAATAVETGERVQVRVLGAPMVLDRDGTPVPGLRAGATQLLVVLATHRDGHPLMDIMEKIWPDATTRRAADRLSTEAANLRRTVRRALGRTEDRSPDTNAIINKGSFYLANPHLLDVDLWRMTDALAAARATDDPTQRAHHLREAIAAHAGPLADGRDYPWADVIRHQLHRDGIRACLHLAALHTDAGDLAEAARLITDAADLDPVSEDLAQRAIRAIAAAGDADGVRARLRSLRVALDEIGEEPTGETLALAANITIARPTLPGEAGGA